MAGLEPRRLANSLKGSSPGERCPGMSLSAYQRLLEYCDKVLARREAQARCLGGRLQEQADAFFAETSDPCGPLAPISPQRATSCATPTSTANSPLLDRATWLTNTRTELWWQVTPELARSHAQTQTSREMQPRCGRTSWLPTAPRTPPLAFGCERR